jgi:hypothetical protein
MDRLSKAFDELTRFNEARSRLSAELRTPNVSGVIEGACKLSSEDHLKKTCWQNLGSQPNRLQ